MPMRIHDVNRDDHPDYENHVECPNCGCNDCEIVEYPAAHGRVWGDGSDPVWSGWGGGGQAKCNHCYLLFHIRAETDEEQEEREGFW